LANNLKLSNASVNGQADLLSDYLDSGYLRIYDGTQAATADTAIGAQNLLAELRFNATASGAASLGVITLNAITEDSSANATGTATWFRALRSDGTTVVFDGSVGAAGADLNLNAVALVTGAAVSVTSFTYTRSKG
jgi:hypothetical protein